MEAGKWVCRWRRGRGGEKAGSASGAKRLNVGMEKWLSEFRQNSRVCFEHGDDEARGQV